MWVLGTRPGSSSARAANTRISEPSFQPLGWTHLLPHDIIAKAGPELAILLPQPPKYCDCRCATLTFGCPGFCFHNIMYILKHMTPTNSTQWGLAPTVLDVGFPRQEVLGLRSLREESVSRQWGQKPLEGGLVLAPAPGSPVGEGRQAWTRGRTYD